jgi:hypothetical protein
MIYCTTYKAELYETDARDFAAARDDLEELIGRPMPDRSEILNRSTGETMTIDWSNHETAETFVSRVKSTSSEQLDAFDTVLQCDLFGVNE